MNTKSRFSSKNAISLSASLLVIIALAAGFWAVRTYGTSHTQDKPATVIENQSVPANEMAAPLAVPDTGWLKSSSIKPVPEHILSPSMRFHLNDGRQDTVILSPADNFHFNDGRQLDPLTSIESPLSKDVEQLPSTLTPADNYHFNDGRQP